VTNTNAPQETYRDAAAAMRSDRSASTTSPGGPHANVSRETILSHFVLRRRWTDTEDLQASPLFLPVPGRKNSLFLDEQQLAQTPVIIKKICKSTRADGFAAENPLYFA